MILTSRRAAPDYSVGMKRLLPLVAGVLLLALAVYYLISELPDVVAGPEPAPASGVARPAGASLSHVAHVHDGDTLYLRPEGATSRAEELTVRLIGIDTPELRPEVECYALEARDRLRELLPQGSPVWVAPGRGLLDRYGRSLLYLWTSDGDFVNLGLVEEGFAVAVDIAPNDEYWPQLRAAEQAAADAGLGLWGGC